jgi:hypothetical protein
MIPEIRGAANPELALASIRPGQRIAHVVEFWELKLVRRGKEVAPGSSSSSAPPRR